VFLTVGRAHAALRMRVNSRNMCDCSYHPIEGGPLVETRRALDCGRGAQVRRAHVAVIIAVSVVLAGCGNEQDSVAQLRATVRKNPDAAEARINLGDAYMETEAYHDAFIQYFTALELAPNSFEAALGLARAHEQLNDVERAAELVAKALKIKADDPSALALQGKLLLRSDQTEEAADAFEETLERDPGNETAHRFLPVAYLRSDRLQEAQRAAEAGLEALPENVEAHMNLATVLLAQEDVDEAERVLRETIELDPADPVPPLRLAELLVREGTKLKEAVELADRSAELETGEGDAEAVAALALSKQGRSEEAIRRLHGAAMAHPRNVRLWLMLASLYRELGEEEAAARAAGMAFRFAPRRRVRRDPPEQGDLTDSVSNPTEDVAPIDPADAEADRAPSDAAGGLTETPPADEPGAEG